MEKNRIQLSPDHKKELVNEFRTSGTTVQLALDYYNNSPLAQGIRKSAKNLLLVEVAKIILSEENKSSEELIEDAKQLLLTETSKIQE
jgi:hypothetical protein